MNRTGYEYAEGRPQHWVESGPERIAFWVSDVGFLPENLRVVTAALASIGGGPLRFTQEEDVTGVVLGIRQKV